MIGLLVTLLGVLGRVLLLLSCLLSVTRRRSEGTRQRIDEEWEEALVERTEEVSSLSLSKLVVGVVSVSSVVSSSLISFKRSGMLIVSMAVVV